MYLIFPDFIPVTDSLDDDSVCKDPSLPTDQDGSTYFRNSQPSITLEEDPGHHVGLITEI